MIESGQRLDAVVEEVVGEAAVMVEAGLIYRPVALGQDARQESEKR